MEIPTPSTKILQTKKLVKANHCQHKTANFYFTSYFPELHFQKKKTKKLLHIKEYKELLKPTLDHISPYYQDR